MLDLAPPPPSRPQAERSVLRVALGLHVLPAPSPGDGSRGERVADGSRSTDHKVDKKPLFPLFLNDRYKLVKEHSCLISGDSPVDRPRY